MRLFLSILYNALSFLISVFAAPFMVLTPRGRARIEERFGQWPELPEGDFVWFHGASMGEIVGLIPLIKRWRERFPGMKILLTATSATGLDRGKEHADLTAMLPFDSTPFIRRALQGRIPKRFIFGENEIWPGLLGYLAACRVKCYMVNARLSERSFRRFKRFSAFFRPALRSIYAIIASNQRSASRFLQLGVEPRCVRVVGNAKYDVEPSIASAEAAQELKRSLFESAQPVLTLGSLRPGEERFWDRALRRYAGAGISFILAPRHQEKFDYFAGYLAELGVAYDRYSMLNGVPSQKGVLLLDTIGQLESIYSFSEVSFVGGTSLPEYTGHNPLEPAMYSSCVALGPHGAFIAEVREDLVEEGALVTIRSQSDAEKLCALLTSDRAVCEQYGKRAYRVWCKHAGAAAKIMEVLAP